jgi:hypothetical protein
MILRLPHLALEITFDRRDIFLVGVVSFLIASIVTARYGDAPGATLLPLLATLPSALNSGRFRVA